ncbi:MAG TPA: hypothetical protein VHM20_02225, partial [Gammaproteobacteria bacterium]|nr:hypothetical protein [Gammaproteobacteria bacterium]
DKDTSPYQLLLKKARTDGRVWQNPVEMTEALPDPAAFFRTSQNAIHITADVVFQAIARLKQGKNHSSHIWFGTDDKNIRPVPALTPEELATLKKRSKTLNVLIEYIHKLEDVQKKSTNVYTKLNYFKDALFANSVRDKKTNTATEDAADEKLNPIIAEMGEWWNSLHPEIQGHIKSLRESSGNHNSIAKVMDVIFSVKDVKDHKRQTDINYCVYLKADMLEKVLRDTAVQAALKNIGHDLELAKVKVDDHILDEWEKAILTELETPQDIFLPEAGAFGSILNYNINLILMRKMPYHFFKGGQKNFEADILLLQKFILNEPDFNELKFIAICLEDPSYQYLHTSNFIKTFLKLLQNDEHKSYENFCRSSEVFSLTPSADTIKILLPWSIQHEKLYFIRYLMGNGKKSLLDVWQNEKSYLQFFQENYSPDLLNKLYELLSQSEDIILDLIQRNDLTNAKIFMTISQIKENTEFLVEATRLENLDLVDFILQQGKPVDVIKALSIVKKSQNTAIFEKLLSYLKMHPEMLKKGVEIKDSEILDTLLQIPFEERAEWQVPELKNNYLIHYAVLKNNHSLLTKALDKKIDVDALNMQQESALEIAIQKDHTSLIKTLLEHGAKKCKNPEKYFIKLIKDREPTIASLLLESIPFEVGAEDDLGKTAFHYALIKGYKFLAIQIIGKIENPVKT